MYVASVLKNFVSYTQITHKMSDAALKTSKSLTWRENAQNIFQIIKDIWGAKF